jgi:hypothetical protein
MTKGHLSTTMLVAGILGIALGGCGNSTNGSAGSGGTTSPGEGSGGAASGGTTSGAGGSVGTGGVASGGTVGTGGTVESGGSNGSGGAQGTGGAVGTGGRTAGGRDAGGRDVGGRGAGGTTEGAGGAVPSGGAIGSGGASTEPIGGSGAGGRTGAGGGAAGATGKGGAAGGGGGGTCTASKDAGTASGSGPHKVVMEMNSDPGIKCGTIYRPADLGGDEKYPIFVWGEGGCSQSGTSNKAAMGEIASHGYFIVADGVASGTACSGGQDGKAFLDYITWAIAENGKSCSAYYDSLDTTKIAADGFSCGGLMAENQSGDPRFTAIGITSSGLFSADQALWKKIHTPFKILLGGSSDMAYTNGLRDYDGISALGIPIILFSKDGAGHGGDLGNAKGDFNTINLAWLNWQLKGDTGSTGKALLYGPSCKYCTASGWEYKSANIE